MTLKNRPNPILLVAAIASMGFIACSDDDDNPTNDETGVDVPTEDVAVDDVGMEDTPMGDTPMGDTPMGDTPMEDTPMEDTPVEGSNIVELAIATDFLSILVDAVVAADLADTLSGEGPFTVFAPTNDAFATLLDEIGLTAEELLADTDTLTAVLLYHVVGESLASGDVVASDILEPLGGGELVVTVEGESVFINDAQITVVDIEATNGYVHVIDTVLVPFADEPNLVEVAEENGSFTILLAAVEAAGLTAVAATTEDITIFAPTDAAFEAAFVALGVTAEELLASPDLAGILAYHVVPELLFSGDVVAASLLPTLAGINLKVVVDGEVVTVGDAVVSALDIEGSNGVIHVVDSVILPPGTVVDVAVASGMFGTLVLAVQAAELVDTLSGDGPFTVFAPTEQAFADALEALEITAEELLASPDLAAILTYHVVAEYLTASDVVALDSVTTVNGASAAISIGDDGAMINEALIVATDIPTSNGIIHVIDAVLLPPAE
ncbi:MAG: putative surface protein with fasciclin (FAS1) repeats [Bradymonadia bacterium]|jgi:uncharacterized surface protein with fasciclin (FAS1) repeats